MGPRRIIGTEVNGSWLNDWIPWSILSILYNELWQGYCIAVLPAYMQPNTIASNIDTCLHLYSNIVILCHDNPGIYYALVHTCRVQQRVIYTILLLIQQWRLCGYRTSHPFHTPALHACVYTQCFYRSIDSVCSARVFNVTVIGEELIGFRGNLYCYLGTPIPFSSVIFW